MRILHINCNYIGTTLHQLMVETLNKRGYDSAVFVPTYDKEQSVIVPDKNVLVCECFKKWDRLAFDHKQKKIFHAVNQNYSVDTFDIIHAYTLFTDGNCARILSKRYGVPYVVAVRNTDVNSFFRWMPHLRGRGVQILLDAEAVFFLSDAYRKQVLEKYVPAKYRETIYAKSHIIPNGIDDFWFENNCKEHKSIDPNGEIRLIYAGRVDRNKNIVSTQKAMLLLREKGYGLSLTVVGKITEKAAFREMQKYPQTEYLPAMPKEKLIEWYRKSDIFVMPSFTESFGLVYVEAMSQGLPVIYSKGQGFDNQFPEGSVGVHVSADDVQSIANGIENVIQNYEKMQSQVVSAAQKYNWQEITGEYDLLYKHIVSLKCR